MTQRLSIARKFGRRSRGVFAGFGVALIGAIVGLTVVDTLSGYRTAQDDAWRDLDAQARVVAEQTARALQAVDVVLRDLVTEHDAGLLMAMPPVDLHKHLQEKSVGLVQTADTVMIDGDGNVRASAMLEPARQPHSNVTADPGFRELKLLNNTQLAIDAVRFAKPIGTWFFPISRTLRSRSGGFEGTVTAMGRVDYFQDFYRDVFVQPGIQVSLLREDGSLIARQPPDETLLGRKSPLIEEFAASATAQSTKVRTRSLQDGVDRLGATRKVPDYPLLVVVSRDAGAVFAQWQSLAWRLAGRTLALAGFAALLLWLAFRQFDRLDAARERYALAAAGSDDGIWDWDLLGDVVFISARAQEVAFGEVGAALRARTAWNAGSNYHADDRQRVRAAISQHLRGSTPHFTVEFRVHHPADAPDRWRWCRQRGIALRGASGRAYRMAGSIEDITARKEAETQREQLEQQLRHAQRLESIGTLAGGIAHDFNNILAAILGFSDLAKKDAAAGSRQRVHIDAAIAAGLRAKSLVERILAFSRTGMGERRPVHVESVVAEALDQVAATLPEGLRLERGFAAGDAGVIGDPTQIHQVVTNLCANAVQASTPPGLICVSTAVVANTLPLPMATSTLHPGRYLRLEVRDTGSGVAPTLIDRIFDPFFTTKEVGVGTGLGLSLVHGIVVDLGGGIAVQSRPGQGSVFTVYLATHGDATRDRAVEAAASLGEGETILFVDDELPLVDLAEETLAELGYDPVPFSSGASALDEFRLNPGRFDLVISDESMPGMTGSELAREIRSLRPDIPIVMMSGFVTPGLMERAHASGVSGVLSKPLSTEELARCLAFAFGRGAALHAGPMRRTQASRER